MNGSMKFAKPLIFAIVALLLVGGMATTVRGEKPFGGQVQSISGCIREQGSVGTRRIFVDLSGPRGGQYIWAETTTTYDYGPPNRVGQWLLGLAGVPYVCVISIIPTVTRSGDYIIFMGSSQ